MFFFKLQNKILNQLNIKKIKSTEIISKQKKFIKKKEKEYIGKYYSNL
jgi:hypothetical protein